MTDDLHSGLSRPAWLVAGLFLVALVVAAAAPRLTADADREAGRLRVFEGLVAARAVAAVGEATSATDPAALRDVVVQLMERDPTIRRAFLIAEGGVDEYGIATGKRFVYDSASTATAIGEADKPILDRATKVSASAAALGPDAVPVRELVAAGRGERPGTRRFVVLVPAMAQGSNEPLGVAGIVRETAPVPITPHFLYGLGLALVGALGFAALLALGWAPRRSFAAVLAAFLIAGSAGAWLDVRGEQERTAQQAALALSNAGAAVAATGRDIAFEPGLAWAATWQERDRPPVARSEGNRFVVASEAPASRLFHRLTMPAAIFLLGLLVALLTLRGTAAMFAGIRRQPGTYAYVLPVLLAMGVVIFFPFLKGVEFAFLDSSAQEFVGLANFQEVLLPASTSHTNFYLTLGVTVMWTVLNVVLHVSIGLGLALLLNNPRLRWRGLYRVLLIIPWAMPNYITALTWKTMFDTNYGAVNALLQSIGLGGVDWLGQSFATNFAANLITNVWLGFPFMMVVSLGALQSIPRDLYEAADIDGAGRWQKFRQITLPLLKPALFPAVILGTIWTFNQFNVIYLVSGGRPDGLTNILITEAYRLFKELNEYGLAAAYCLLIFVILLVYTVMTNRITKATEGAFDG